MEELQRQDNRIKDVNDYLIFTSSKEQTQNIQSGRKLSNRKQGCVLVTPKPIGSRWSQLKRNKMKNNKKKGGRPALENKKQFRINVRFDESEHNRVESF